MAGTDAATPNPTPSPAIKTKEPKTEWIAVIYSPNKEVRPRSHINELLGASIQLPQPAHPLFLGLPPEKTVEGGVGVAMEGRSIFLSPGTNLGISSLDWEQVKEHPLVLPKLENKIIQVYEPTEFKEGNDVKYARFKPDIAVELINNTLHEDRIDEWILGESREVVLKAASAGRAELVRIKAARAAA